MFSHLNIFSRECIITEAIDGFEKAVNIQGRPAQSCKMRSFDARHSLYKLDGRSWRELYSQYVQKPWGQHHKRYWMTILLQNLVFIVHSFATQHFITKIKRKSRLPLQSYLSVRSTTLNPQRTNTTLYTTESNIGYLVILLHLFCKRHWWVL